MNSADSAFQIVHANYLQAILPTKSCKVNYNCASPIGPNEAGVFLRRESLSTVFVSPSTMANDATMRDCGFPTTLSSDILAAMWTKWVMLSSMAAITCLLRGSVGQVVAVHGGLETVHALIAESSAIATANGYPQTPEFLAQHTARMTQPGSALTASMFRDLQKGAPVEVEHILGDFLARGQAHGVETPLLRAAYVQLSIYSASLERK